MKNHPPIEILSASIDGSLSDERLREVRGHVDSCEGCRRELDDLRCARASLRALPPLSAPRELVAALRREFAAPPVAAAPSQTWRWWRFAAPVAAAAALAAGVWFRRAPRQPEMSLEPLLAAHSRYEAETLVPQPNFFDANFSAHLASYYENEN